MKKISNEEIKALQAFADVIYKSAKSYQKQLLLDESELFWTLDAIGQAANTITVLTYTLETVNKERG